MKFLFFKAEINQCVNEFTNSRYDAEMLTELKEKAIHKSDNNDTNPQEQGEDTLVFPVHYFQDLKEFKNVLYDLSDDNKELIGDTRVIFAVKKRPSIGSVMVQNKQLGMKVTTTDDQRCNARGCSQCPLVNDNNNLIINEKPITIPRNLNCKSQNVIYLWVCKLCHEAYFGRIIQDVHHRSNNHRSCFTREDKWESLPYLCMLRKYTVIISLWSTSISRWSRRCPRNNLEGRNINSSTSTKLHP